MRMFPCPSVALVAGGAGGNAGRSGSGGSIDGGMGGIGGAGSAAGTNCIDTGCSDGNACTGPRAVGTSAAKANACRWRRPRSRRPSVHRANRGGVGLISEGLLDSVQWVIVGGATRVDLIDLVIPTSDDCAPGGICAQLDGGTATKVDQCATNGSRLRSNARWAWTAMASSVWVCPTSRARPPNRLLNSFPIQLP